MKRYSLYLDEKITEKFKKVVGPRKMSRIVNYLLAAVIEMKLSKEDIKKL